MFVPAAMSRTSVTRPSMSRVTACEFNGALVAVAEPHTHERTTPSKSRSMLDATVDPDPMPDGLMVLRAEPLSVVR